jgi:hypothetical protein
MAAQTTAEILDKAADILDENGLHQGDYVYTPQEDEVDLTPDTCPVCVLGAINLAAGRRVDEEDWTTPSPARTAAMALAAHLRLDVSYGDIVEVLGIGWSDADGRTTDEAVEALRGAAEAERAKEAS